MKFNARFLRETREAKGWSPEELAMSAFTKGLLDKYQLTQPHYAWVGIIHAVESEQLTPSFEAVVILADCLGITDLRLFVEE